MELSYKEKLIFLKFLINFFSHTEHKTVVVSYSRRTQTLVYFILNQFFVDFHFITGILKVYAVGV